VIQIHQDHRLAALRIAPKCLCRRTDTLEPTSLPCIQKVNGDRQLVPGNWFRARLFRPKACLNCGVKWTLVSDVVDSGTDIQARAMKLGRRSQRGAPLRS
jgi:hypothetical protein